MRLKSEIQEPSSIQARRSLRRFCFPCGVLESMDGGLRVASALAMSSSKPNNSKIFFLKRNQDKCNKILYKLHLHIGIPAHLCLKTCTCHLDIAVVSLIQTILDCTKKD